MYMNMKIMSWQSHWHGENLNYPYHKLKTVK